MTDLILNGLAAWRLVRLIHSDQITDDLRAEVIGWTLRNGLTKTRYLLQCQHCLGVWCAAVVLGLRGNRARDLLAVAGLSSLLVKLVDSPS